MDLTQSETERIHDEILKYLNTKGRASVDEIANGINKYYRYRSKIIAELVVKELVEKHSIERKEAYGYGFGNQQSYTRTEYTYSISPQGREFMRKGGFRNKTCNYFKDRPDLLILIPIALLSVSLNIWHSCNSRPISDTPQVNQSEETPEATLPISNEQYLEEKTDTLH